MSRDDTRFSVFSYDTKVHKDSQILLNSHVRDKDGLLDELDAMEYNGGCMYRCPTEAKSLQIVV